MRESRYHCRWRDPPSTPPSLNLHPPHLLRPPHPNHDRLKVCSMYLKSVVRVYAAPAALLQLHLRVKILLVLLHDVRQVRAPAALCVVLLAVAVVVVMVLRGNRTEEVGKRSLSGRDQLRLHSFIFLSLYFGDIFGDGLRGDICKETKESACTTAAFSISPKKWCLALMNSSFGCLQSCDLIGLNPHQACLNNTAASLQD